MPKQLDAPRTDPLPAPTGAPVRCDLPAPGPDTRPSGPVEDLVDAIGKMHAAGEYGRRPVALGVQIQRYETTIEEDAVGEFTVQMWRLWINGRAVAKTPAARYLSDGQGRYGRSSVRCDARHPVHIAEALVRAAAVRCEADRKTVARWDLWQLTWNGDRS